MRHVKNGTVTCWEQVKLNFNLRRSLNRIIDFLCAFFFFLSTGRMSFPTFFIIADYNIKYIRANIIRFVGRLYGLNLVCNPLRKKINLEFSLIGSKASSSFWFYVILFPFFFMWKKMLTQCWSNFICVIFPIKRGFKF